MILFKRWKRSIRLHLTAGDTVFFKAGETFVGSLVIDPGAVGSLDKPIIVTSYGSGHAIINAKDSLGILINNGKHLKIQNLTLIGSGRKAGNIKDGLAILNSNNIEVYDLDISGFQKSGLLLYASKNVVAKNVFVHDNGAAGITVEGPYQKRESDHIQILNCRAENNPGDPTKLDNHSGNGIVVGNCKNVLIDHCTATRNGWDMPRIGNGPVGIGLTKQTVSLFSIALLIGTKLQREEPMAEDLIWMVALPTQSFNIVFLMKTREAVIAFFSIGEQAPGMTIFFVTTSVRMTERFLIRRPVFISGTVQMMKSNFIIVKCMATSFTMQKWLQLIFQKQARVKIFIFTITYLSGRIR